MPTRHLVRVAILLAALFTTSGASAFCGFYVGGGKEKLYNDATMVVLMRQGTQTVVSMQNNYQGPAEDFAMVVPVPVVLKKADVKTLPRSVFQRVDKLASPRLVEYWEQDPCKQAELWGGQIGYGFGAGGLGLSGIGQGGGGSHKAPVVRVRAKFTVAEYDIVILSAKDAGGLETWLRDHKYRMPPGAAKLLKPYVEEGMKFFVAKVNSKKVKMQNGRAVLSPLRFHYEDKKFRLPVRLGMLNAKNKQDLIVHILAPNRRYEAANMKNVTMPTNVEVNPFTKGQFGSFYESLFDHTVRVNPRTAITEYSWAASKCDPCPTPGLTPSDLASLGADVAFGAGGKIPTDRRRRARQFGFARSMVLTRLHLRYGKNALAQDLVFRPTGAIEGGREIQREGGDQHGARPASRNNFQARYIIRHPWAGKLSCDAPVRGVWGGRSGKAFTPARNLGAQVTSRSSVRTLLGAFLAEDVARVGLRRRRTSKASAGSWSHYPSWLRQTMGGVLNLLMIAPEAG